MRRDRSFLLFVGVALWGFACSEPPPPPVEGGSFTLSSGVRVDVADETGAIALFDGDRPLLATPSRGPVARTFSERVTGPVGIWTFRRFDEVTRGFDRFASVRERDGAVEVDYALVPTDAQPEEGTATMRIAPGERANTTVVTLEVEGAANSVAFPVRCDPEGSFHGFGEQYNATEQTGEAFLLHVSEQGIGREGNGLRDISGDAHTTYFPMPYYLDARGFGVLVRTDRRVNVDVCQTDAEVAWLEVHDDAPLELLVFHGPTPLDVIDQLGQEVGRPAPPPDWAWGLWISSQGGADAVMADVAALEAAEIPVAAIWSQDWTGLRMNVGGGFGVQYRWNADLEHYPALTAMIDDLHTRGIRFLAYANPFIDPNLDDHFPTLREEGLLIRDDAGEPYLFAGGPGVTSSHPDFTNEATRDYVRAELRGMVDEHGIDGWMADFGEWNPLDAVMSDGSDPEAFHNRFPVEWHRVNREALDAARPDGDWVTIARSGWTGVQRHSMIHWVGDQEATWSEADGLPTVVPAMITLGLAGVPYATHDIGGFSGGPSTEELYRRWVELGAFTPIMRTHEGNRRDVNHNWDSNPETTAHVRRFARVHDALRAELIAWSAEAQATGAPLVRHLLLEFPEDRASWDVHDQYLLGDALLVAPVTEEGATSREVYFPAGDAWFHVWSGTRYEGGQTVEVDAPIGEPPVFSRGADRDDLRTIASAG
ncbi:MAG: TIM-barrel domain-containing protein [Sandaracinaceae bacterium]